jgi:hypothetical protein
MVILSSKEAATDGPSHLVKDASTGTSPASINVLAPSVTPSPIMVGTGNHDYMYLLTQGARQLPPITSAASVFKLSSNKTVPESSTPKTLPVTSSPEGLVVSSFSLSSSNGSSSTNGHLSPCEVSSTVEAEGFEGDFSPKSSQVPASKAQIPTSFCDEEYLKMKDLVQQMKESFEENIEVSSIVYSAGWF